MKNQSRSMFQSTSGKGVAIFCVFVILGASGARAAMQTLRGMVPAAVAHLQAEGTVPGTNRLNLAIGLPLRNREALTDLLHDLYDPASPQYRRFLTPEQFAERFGPTEQDYQAVMAFAKANGLTVTATHPNRVLLDVNGTISDIEKAFHTTLRVYQHPNEKRTFHAPDVEPSLDLSVPVLHISGLDDFSLPRPRMTATQLVNGQNAAPNAGSGPIGTYMGYDFRAAYAPDVSNDGDGQAVGLLQFDGYTAGDIAYYENLAGLPNVPLVNVLVNGATGLPSGSGGEIEVSLDIEMAISMAPNLNKVIVYMAPNPSPWVDLLNRMATDNQAKQLSCSWYQPGGTANALTDQIFQQMAVQGQTFFNASGDYDAYVGLIDFPGDTPYITQVGGTTLTTSGAGGAYTSETAWNWGNGIGTGGGISTQYPIPTWQTGISMTANHGSTTMRNIPDVALTADNVFVRANGKSYKVGGTSCAAPLWGGFMALVNQQAVASGQTPVGFLNPVLTTLGLGSTYTSDFHDIKTGSNTNSISPTNFFAVVGYDLCTGWGTPNGQHCINEIAGLPPRLGFIVLSVNPPSDSVLLKSFGQPIYVTVKDVYAVTNATVTGSIPGVTNLTFLDNGVAPDVKANDGIYSALFQVPGATNPLTMTVTALATNEIGATNIVNYTVVGAPANDNFTNATAIPAAGGVYLSNNRFATLEPGEPQHNADARAGASLWWTWKPTNNTNVYVNTIGSGIENVLAVYTGSTVSNLVQVAATNSTLAQYQPARLKFNALANTTYRIAVASWNSNVVGTVALQLIPGGQPDTNKPVVTVDSPLSGLTVTNNLATLAGTASDPQPNSSGLNKILITSFGIVFTASGTTNWTGNALLLPGLNTIQVTAVDNTGNYSTPATVQLYYYVQNPVNDYFAAALPLNALVPSFTGISGHDAVSNTNATKELGEPDHAGNVGGKSVWWWFQPPSDGVLTLDTAGSSFDTLLGLYTGTNVANLTAVADNDDAYFGAPGGYSRLDQAVRSNLLYHIAVDGYGGASGNVVLNYSFQPATLYHLTTSSTAGGSVQVSTTNGLGGVLVLPGTAGDFAANSLITLTAQPAANYQFDIWNGSWLSLSNPVTGAINGNLSLTANFRPLAFTDGFESGNLQQLPWTTAGNLPWFVQSSVVSAGQYAARSGLITNSQSSSLILATNFHSGAGSFSYRVSSEANYDFLKFYLDGVLMQQWSGEAGWATYSFSLTAGFHTLMWTYIKDPSNSGGLDAAFLDNVIVPIVVATNSVATPILQYVNQTGGGVFLNLSGQTNQQYIIQTSSNLFTWKDASTNILLGGFLRMPDTSMSTNRIQFYRAMLAP
ncbi:MAG TPA: protease pro-enzyme activation domain-containing protein [Candidatus Acidoferrum sp.]|nr:protease pro-enzyme activation domain-containing protein [Candidatus Acidoferrum sp.]